MGHTTLVGCATVKVALPLFLSPFIVVAATSAKRHELTVDATIHGRNKFFSLVASNFQQSKYVGLIFRAWNWK
ncbi:hypothetical protein BVRB_6g148450 isoform B [Beta vulgaris subsp. vulgaris]|nr:hypothetical protein BVRB_6g148450 isoform B [Beta vulgaris subsp. vulgaris]